MFFPINNTDILIQISKISPQIYTVFKQTKRNPNKSISSAVKKYKEIER